MQAIFKIANESDAGEIALLVNQAYRPSSGKRGWTHEADLVAGERATRAQVLSLFVPGSAVLSLSHGDAIVACVHVQHHGTAAYIGMLATMPGHQACGLGKKMLCLAEEYAASHFKAGTFRMSVLASRSELVAFYERRGYVRTGQLEHYPVSAGVGQPLRAGLEVELLIKKTNGNFASEGVHGTF